MGRALIASLLAAASAAGQTILVESLPGDESTLPRLAKAARARLDANPGPMTQATLFAGEPSPFFLTQSPLESFGQWLAGWRTAAKVRWVVAQAIAIGDDAAMRVRVGRSMTRLGLKGKDPLVMLVEGRRYDVLHLASPGPGRATVYVRGPGPLPCQEVLERLRSKTGLRLRVRMRSDPWFLHDPGFPPYYWFYTGEPPTRAAVAAAPAAECGG